MHIFHINKNTLASFTSGDDTMHQQEYENTFYDVTLKVVWGESPPPEERHAFSAFLQVCGISHDYFGPFQASLIDAETFKCSRGLILLESPAVENAAKKSS